MQILSASEQIAQHLRSEITNGHLTGEMPGCDRLANDLGTCHDTVDRALRQLEKEGFLISQGRRRPRKIVLPDHLKPLGLRVGFLLFEPSDMGTDFIIRSHELLNEDGPSPFVHH